MLNHFSFSTQIDQIWYKYFPIVKETWFVYQEGVHCTVLLHASYHASWQRKTELLAMCLGPPPPHDDRFIPRGMPQLHISLFIRNFQEFKHWTHILIWMRISQLDIVKFMTSWNNDHIFYIMKIESHHSFVWKFYATHRQSGKVPEKNNQDKNPIIVHASWDQGHYGMIVQTKYFLQHVHLFVMRKCHMYISVCRQIKLVVSTTMKSAVHLPFRILNDYDNIQN